jgi:cytochrome c5
MKLNRKFAVFLLGAAAFALSTAGVARADDLDAATKARLAQFDSGPATVDVSKYPQAIQDDYKVFSQKCAQCHKLSRPINSDYVLPDEWARYVKRMMYKPGSGISGAEAKEIYEFLVYDSSVRKKDLLEKKLATLDPKQKAAEQAKVQEVRGKYGETVATK